MTTFDTLWDGLNAERTALRDPSRHAAPLRAMINAWARDTAAAGVQAAARGDVMGVRWACARLTALGRVRTAVEAAAQAGGSPLRMDTPMEPSQLPRQIIVSAPVTPPLPPTVPTIPLTPDSPPASPPDDRGRMFQTEARPHDRPGASQNGGGGRCAGEGTLTRFLARQRSSGDRLNERYERSAPCQTTAVTS